MKYALPSFCSWLWSWEEAGRAYARASQDIAKEETSDHARRPARRRQQVDWRGRLTAIPRDSERRLGATLSDPSGVHLWLGRVAWQLSLQHDRRKLQTLRRSLEQALSNQSHDLVLVRN